MLETILDNFFIFITQFGAELFYMIFLPPIFWCLNKKFGFRLFYLSLLAGYIAALLKNLVDLPRPPKEQWKTEPDASGFPSGHTMGTTSLWGYLGIKVRNSYVMTIGLTIIILVAISRVYLGVHYPIDIVGGILFGFALILGFLVFEPKISIIINNLKFSQKLALSILIPAIFTIFAFQSLPGDIRIISGAGALFGVSIGYVLECETTNFNLDVSRKQKVLRVFIGFLIAFSAFFGLIAIIPDTPAWHYAHASLGGFNVMFVAPVVFTSIEKYS